MEKKLNFKKLLATASAFAVIAGASNSAMAAAVTDNDGGDVVIGNGADANTNGAFVNGDNFYFANANHALTTGGAITINAIDLNNKAPAAGGFTVAHAVTLGPVTDSVGANTIDVIVDDGLVLTLANNVGTNAIGGDIDAGTFDGLGNITLGSGGGAGTLTVDTDAELTGTINSNVANADGIININAGRTLTLSGIVGGNTGLAEINLVGADSVVVVNADVKAATILTQDATAKVQVAGGKIITGAVDATVAGGILFFDGAGTVTGAIGAGNALTSIVANGAGAVALQGAVTANTLTVANVGADVRLANANALTGNVSFTANGTVSVAAGGTITGNVTTDVDNTGKLVFVAGGGGVANGTIGADGSALKTVEVTGAGAVALNGTAHYAETFKFGNVAAQLTIADNGSLHGNATGNAAGNGVIQFDAKGELVGTAHNLVSVIANGNGVVTIGAGKHKVTTFEAHDANAAFTFADGADVEGAINNTSGGVNATELNFAGNSIVTGNIGNANAFSVVNIGEGTVAIGADLTATNVNFADAEDSILQIQGGVAHIITGKISENDNKGTIKIAADVGANAVTFASEIGDHAAAGKKLKLLEIASGFTGQVQLDADTHITDVQIGGGSIRLNAHNYKFGGITLAEGSDKGALLVNANATLVGPGGANVANLGTSDNKLEKLEFTNDHTLTIGDGVNIHVNQFDNGGNNHGKLVFEGTSIFEANALVAADHKLNTITLNDKANVTILSPNTVVNGVTTLGDGSILAIAGDFNANGGLVGANDAVGTTLKFINAKKATIAGAAGAAGAVGAANASLASIEFAGGDVEFTSDVVHKAGQAFVFSGDNAASTVTFNATTNVGDNVFTNTSGATHTVVLGVNTIFTKNLATSVDNQLNFQLGAANATITNGDATGTNFTTGADNTGELNLAKPADGLVINSAGESDKSLAKVNFANSATITKDTYAQEVIVAAANTATLGGTIKSGNFHLAGAATVSFLDNAVVDSVIKTDNGGQGVVEFTGGATIMQNLGTGAANALDRVTFADDAKKTALLGANIYAKNITMQQGVVKLTDNAALNGATTATATTLNLGDNTLTAKGDLTFNGANKIEFSTTNVDNTLAGGKITMAAGKLVFVNDAELAITADDKGHARPTGGASHVFTLIDGDFGLDLSKVTVGSTNQLTKWTPSKGENNRLILTQTDNAEGEINRRLGSNADAANKENAAAFAKAKQGSDGEKVIDFIGKIDGSKAEIAANTKEVLDRVVPLTTVADSIEGTMNEVAADVVAHLADLQGNSVQNTGGVSAGDDHAKFGAWFSPFYNNTTQKARKGAAGYKGESYGASFGFDTKTNEDTIIGAAFTAANSELKHKNFKSGDKTKVNSLLFSIYGMHQVTDTWFALGSATVGTNEIRNSERRGFVNNYETASAKYSSMSFSGEVMFGYNHVTEQATITPMGGFRYTRVNDGGYKETGTAFQNLDVSTKASNKFEVILGARASGGTFDLNGLSVTPEVHAFINHDLIGKNSKQSIKLDSTTLTGKSNKPVRTTYNLGLGANAEFGAMEYGASYDAQLADKRVGHQGTLRLRVNF